MHGAIAVAALCLGTSVAHADKPSTSKPSAKAEADAPPKPQRLNFEDEMVDGEVWSPDHSIVDATRAVRFHPLIRIRATFVPEMIKAAEDF